MNTFSPDYETARSRFRQAASELGWQLESLPIATPGPEGEDLTVDVASSPGNIDKVLVTSSGVHGVEGFFGSAVQIALLEQWAATEPPPVKCVFLHGLNPFGFAWLRRFDEENIDPNRNFLLPGEEFKGAPPGFAGLDELINPKRPPSRFEPFTLKALMAIARHGMQSLKESIATGQYEFPQGLFFGGSGPSNMHNILAENLGRWVEGSRQVVHLDFHTGLGPHGTWKLLIDYPLNKRQRRQLTDWFGPDSFEGNEKGHTAYDARGGFGRWCIARELAPHYLFACAEFGTYSPIKVLAGLRAENQAHHWGEPNDRSTVRTKQHLKELFCPADAKWRETVLKGSIDLVERTVRGLEQEEMFDSDANR